MNLGLHLYNYLQEKGSAELPGFGVFTLKKKSATLDEQSSKILPPTYEISFVENKNVFNADFSKYIVEKTGENLFVVQSLIKEEVSSWLEALSAEQKITIDEIGEFSLEENVIKLLDQKKYTNTPKFFGLEEISLEQIQNSENSEDLPESDNQYVGKQYLDNTETQSLQLNDYFLTDFNAQYEFKIAKQDVSLQFLLNNIFDKKYVNNGFVYDGPYYYAQAGRNFMIGLSFKIK